MRPLLMNMCIKTAAQFLGDDPAHPGPLAIALGTAVSEGLVAPGVLGLGATVAEAAGRLMKRTWTSADVVGPKSPDFAPDLASHIGTAFTIMSFALAYQAAMGEARITAEQVFVPAAIGGGATGAVAVGTALLGPELRAARAWLRGTPLQGNHNLVIQGPQQTGHCGARLCARLRSASTGLGDYAAARVRAAAEMNRELVLGILPVIEAQMILNVMQPHLDPAQENLLGLQDMEGMTAHEQFALLSASLTMIVHMKRVEGWTNQLFGGPVPKADMQKMTVPHLLTSCGAAVVNLAITCISGYLAREAVLWGEGASIAGAAGDAEYGFDGGVHELDLIAGLMIGALALRAIGSGPIGDAFRRSEMAGSLITGIGAGVLTTVPGAGSMAAGLALSSGAHALAQPPYERPDVRTPAGRDRWRATGIHGFTGKVGHLVVDTLGALGTGLARGLGCLKLRQPLKQAQAHADHGGAATNNATPQTPDLENQRQDLPEIELVHHLWRDGVEDNSPSKAHERERIVGLYTPEEANRISAERETKFDMVLPTDLAEWGLEPSALGMMMERRPNTNVNLTPMTAGRPVTASSLTTGTSSSTTSSSSSSSSSTGSATVASTSKLRVELPKSPSTVLRPVQDLASPTSPQSPTSPTSPTSSLPLMSPAQLRTPLRNQQTPLVIRTPSSPRGGAGKPR
ncbi:hypothetical protein [Caenimonas koreensis]|nr:hypothetical protein [Caenimonas koreensis]